MFVYQFSSRREVNQKMTTPQFQTNLKCLFPELESLPHADTLYRLLEKIKVEQIERCHLDLVHRLIRGKKFNRYLINNCYPIALDGSQKMAGDILWDSNLLQRRVGKNEDEKIQYYAYVIETALVFSNGMTIPFLSEFLEFAAGASEEEKQDCEMRAFHRIVERIKAFFPRLPIMLLLDGLYANGPVFVRCEALNWQYMIVFKDGCLPTAWLEANELKPYQPKNKLSQRWGERQQDFYWVNGIEYEFKLDGVKQTCILNLVACEEQWENVDKNGHVCAKSSRHVWLSSRPLNHNNVHERCNLGARHRWGIEAGFLVEKHQGYSYEHAFALNWNAMKGYHFLMRLAHLLNTLLRFTCVMGNFFRQYGIRGALSFIRETLTGPWLNDIERITECLNRPFQLKLE